MKQNIMEYYVHKFIGMEKRYISCGNLRLGSVKYVFLKLV